MKSAPLPPVMAKPSVTVVCWLNVMMTPVVMVEAVTASTETICASVAVFKSNEVAVRRIVSDVPAPPVTVSWPPNPINVSFPEPPVRASSPLPPVIENASPAVVWLVRIMMTPAVVDEASIASTETICVLLA